MNEVHLGRRPRLPQPLPSEGGAQPHSAAAVLLYNIEKVQPNLDYYSIFFIRYATRDECFKDALMHTSILFYLLPEGEARRL